MVSGQGVCDQFTDRDPIYDCVEIDFNSIPNCPTNALNASFYRSIFSCNLGGKKKPFPENMMLKYWPFCTAGT